MENDLTKEPILEEYGLDASSYEDYRNKKNHLEKLLTNYVITYSSIGYLIIIIAFFVGLFSQSGILVICGLVIGGIIAFVENNKDKEIIKKRKEIYTEIEFIKNKVYKFEKDCEEYYSNYLENFFHNNLYKKRSGSEKFEQSLNQFASMINEVEEINKKLIFADIQHYHGSYLSSRQIDHRYQKERNFNSFNNIKIKTEEGEKAIEDLVIDPNQKIKDEFRKKVELERIEKEKTRLMSPEKKFRTARKIDNWEEINKKRKEAGDNGEEVVFLLEQNYLESINRKDLADKVYHSSKERGDGLGYDILSYFDDGREKYIEVKSTNNSINSTFNISKNELEFLKENLENAFLYRVSFQEEIPEIEIKTSYQILESKIIPTQFSVKME